MARKRGCFPAVPLEQRFWTKVLKTTSCWTWTRNRDVSGYGVIKYLGKNRKAHRIAWELTHGMIPAGKMVCHTCDNPPCVRPDHLFLGDAQLNRADAVRKGRHAHGESVTISKLTQSQVLAARKTYEAGHISISQLARCCGVSQRAMILVLRRQTWKHV